MKTRQCTNKEECGHNHFKRARYFHGMLLGDQDFKDEQNYHLEKRRLLNRTLHGWGVVCGLQLKKKEGTLVEVSDGLALDCWGREILICDKLTIDVEKLLCDSGKATPDSPLTPEECEERERGEATKHYWVGIRYKEYKSNPVPVYVPGESCEEKVCQHSRIREGFCIEILPQCPHLHEAKKGLLARLRELEEAFSKGKQDEYSKEELDRRRQEIWEEFCGRHFSCDECGCDQKHVGLGKLTVQFKDGCIHKIQVSMDECRCYVLGPRMWRWLIESALGGCEGLNPCNPMSALCWLTERCKGEEKQPKKEDSLEKKYEELKSDYDALVQKQSKQKEIWLAYSKSDKTVTLQGIKATLEKMYY